jgi:hypothetical protein
MEKNCLHKKKSYRFDVSIFAPFDLFLLRKPQEENQICLKDTAGNFKRDLKRKKYQNRTNLIKKNWVLAHI